MPTNHTNDPIHGFLEEPCTKILEHNIIITDVLKKINSHPKFIRCNNILQLAVSYYTFSGSTHTRMSHQKGVAHLSNKYLNHLIENNNFNFNDIKTLFNDSKIELKIKSNSQITQNLLIKKLLLHMVILLTNVILIF